MIALALLFILIIMLLWVIVWLLQRYFKAYSYIHMPDNVQVNKIESRADIRKHNMQELEAEINTLVNQRLLEMEKQIPASNNAPELQASEILTENFKQLLHSTLSLLKINQCDTRR